MTLIIVTCRTGNTEWCIEEIGNTLYPHDPGVDIRETRHRGVLLVRTSLSYTKTLNTLSSREYGFAEKIIPLEETTSPDPGAIAETALRLAIKHGVREACLSIRIRGIRGLSTKAYRETRRLLENNGVRITPRTHICIYIEGVDETIGAAVLPWPPPGRRATLEKLGATAIEENKHHGADSSDSGNTIEKHRRSR